MRVPLLCRQTEIFYHAFTSPCDSVTCFYCHCQAAELLAAPWEPWPGLTWAWQPVPSHHPSQECQESGHPWGLGQVKARPRHGPVDGPSSAGTMAGQGRVGCPVGGH